jgi:hypothetical protein
MITTLALDGSCGKRPAVRVVGELVGTTLIYQSLVTAVNAEKGMGKGGRRPIFSLGIPRLVWVSAGTSD